MIQHNLIEGSSYLDDRGKLNFCNAFDMGEIVRFYEIEPSNTSIIRAWQGHRKEKKWFYCNAGAFIVNLIKLDNFEVPSKNSAPVRFVLAAKNPAVLQISGGYATGFKALENHSKLMVFSNFNLEESKQDDFRYPLGQWAVDWG